MRRVAISLLALAVVSSVSAQQQTDSNHLGTGPATVNEGPNLSPEKLGSDDLLGVSVYDAPELTRSVRVDAEGNIRLPMLKQHIHAASLNPTELENAISAALIEEHIMVDPIVSVSVIEYHSRPITVVGAVKAPTTFQASGSVTLLEAIVRAGGLSDNAGSTILISHPPSLTGGAFVSLTDRVSVHSLMDISNPSSNLQLEGGENVRVLEAGRIFVVGNVKHPGPLQITDGSESSVLKAVTLSGGLDSFSSKTAYIYRTEGGGRRGQIPIEIKRIMTLKSPDVPLYGDDMLYVPNATGQRISTKALEIAVGVGLGVTSLLVYILR